MKTMIDETTINFNGLSALMEDIVVGTMDNILIVDMGTSTRILENTHIHLKTSKPHKLSFLNKIRYI